MLTAHLGTLASLLFDNGYFSLLTQPAPSGLLVGAPAQLHEGEGSLTFRAAPAADSARTPDKLRGPDRAARPERPGALESPHPALYLRKDEPGRSAVETEALEDSAASPIMGLRQQQQQQGAGTGPTPVKSPVVHTSARRAPMGQGDENSVPPVGTPRAEVGRLMPSLQTPATLVRTPAGGRVSPKPLGFAPPTPAGTALLEASPWIRSLVLAVQSRKPSATPSKPAPVPHRPTRCCNCWPRRPTSRARTSNCGRAWSGCKSWSGS